MLVVVVADMHVGSRVALAIPDETPNDAGRVVRQQLYDRWVQATTGLCAKPDALIVLGDATDGPNRKNMGIGTWTTDLTEQADHAVDLIRMWGAKKHFILRGSRYHVEAGGGMLAEEYIARKLNAEPYPGQENVRDDWKQRSGWHWYLRFGDITFHCQHYISVSRVFHYQSTPTARQLLQVKLNDHLRNEMKKWRTKVVLRAHAHYYNTVGYSGSEGYVVPCWKALDDYMQEKGALDISPDIGYMWFRPDKDGPHGDKKTWPVQEIQGAPLTIVGGTDDGQ